MMEDNLSYMRTEAPLLAPIFRSDGQARLLSTLLLTGDELSLTDLAERAGVSVRSLTPVQASLEEVFAELTRGDARQPAEEATA